jgi:WD40 repeat protein
MRTFVFSWALLTTVLSAANAEISWSRQVKPILQKRCQGCHQPASQGGRLVLTTFEALRAGGASGAGFKPGRPEESLLVKYIVGNPPAMPKNAPPLTPGDIETIRRWIAEGARDDTPKRVDPIGPGRPPVYTAPPVLSAMAWSPDGSILAVGGYREVLLLKPEGGAPIARLVGRSPRIESIAFSRDGKLLAAGGGAPAVFGEVQIWDVARAVALQTVEIGYDVMYGISFSPDSKLVCVGGADNSVRLVGVDDGKVRLKFDNHSDWVFSTTFSVDGKHFLSTGRDRAVKLVVAENGSFVDDINTHTSPYRAMVRHPSMDHVFVAGEDGIVRRYQVFRTKARTMNQEDHNLLKTFEKQPDQINALAVSADGALIAVGGESREIRIYAVETGARAAVVRENSGAKYALQFRPGTHELAVGGLDGSVRIYDADTGRLLRSFVPVPLSRTSSSTQQKQPLRR